MPWQNVIRVRAPLWMLGLCALGLEGCQKSRAPTVESALGAKAKPTQSPGKVVAKAGPSKSVLRGSPAPVTRPPSSPAPASVNQAPVVVSPGLQVVSEGALLRVDAVVTDDDGIDDALTFSCLSGCPTGSTLSSTTGRFDWTPSYSQAGGYQITLAVSDGALVTSFSFDVSVMDVDTTPSIPLVSLSWSGVAQLDETCRISVPGQSVAVTGQSIQSSTGSLSLGSAVTANFQGLTGALTSFTPGDLTAIWNVTSAAGQTTTLQKNMTLSASTALLRPLRAPDPFVDATADVSPGREVERGGTCQNCTTGLRGSIAVAVDSRSGKSSFVCALVSNGTVKCWGSNERGAVGNGGTTNVNTPTAVFLGVGVTAKAIAAGGNHACAILSTGDVKCWGEDFYGGAGAGTPSNSTPPYAQLSPVSVNLGVGRTARSIALGDVFSCAILDDGEVKCWGYGWEGQLGNGAFTESASPVSVSLPSGSVAVGLAAGATSACALLSSDKVYCWGGNYFGQLGTGIALTSSPWGSNTPQEVTALSGANTVSLSVGAFAACALKNDGSLRCWGKNGSGETGVGYPSPASPYAILTPTQVVGLDRRAVSVSVGRQSTCAVLADGEVKCWGHFQRGALGYSNGSYDMLYGPSSPVRNVTSALAVSAGNNTTCALHADTPSSASVKCWGEGANGELGIGSFPAVGAFIPVTATDLTPAFRTGCQAYALSSSGALASHEFIEVEPTRVVADVSQFPVGINTNYLVDNDANRSSGARGLGPALEDLGVKFMRFPEGETADTYLWSVPPYTSPQPTLARVGNDVWPSMDRVLFGVDGVTPVRPLLGFDQFMSLATARGATPILTVAFDSMYPSATPPTTRPSKQTLIDTAREWVRYSNVTQGYGVKYWELGNETNLSTHDGGMVTAATYATDFQAFATEMKSVDSTIKLGANGFSGAWFDTLLQQVGASIDWLVVHTYPPAGGWTSYSSYADNNESLTLAYDAALSSLARTGPSEYARIGIGLTEYNAASFDGAWADTNDLGHALVAFEILGQHLKRPRLLFTQQWATRWIHDFYSPARAVRSPFDALDNANQLTPTGRSVAIWGKHLRRNVVFSGNGPAVRSYATAGSPDGVVSVFLVNKSLSTKKTTVRVKGLVPSAPAHVWTLSGTGPNDTAPVWTSASDAAFVGENVTLDLAPSSITVLEASP